MALSGDRIKRLTMARHAAVIRKGGRCDWLNSFCLLEPLPSNATCIFAPVPSVGTKSESETLFR
jgi:hypothetical protein